MINETAENSLFPDLPIALSVFLCNEVLLNYILMVWKQLLLVYISAHPSLLLSSLCSATSTFVNFLVQSKLSSGMSVGRQIRAFICFVAEVINKQIIQGNDWE